MDLKRAHSIYQLYVTSCCRWARTACASILLAAAFPAAAQPLSNLVFTVGTTIQDANSSHWSYVLIGSPQPQLLAGRSFAVYSKPDYSTNPGTFTLRGIMARQTGTAGINSLLNQSTALGEDLLSLSNALNVLFMRIPGITNQTLAEKVLTGFQLAWTDPATAQTLTLLARVHPGLNLCLGHAFAERIAAVTTYEVREIDPGTGAHGDVIGRVTVTPGLPVILPAPGYPFQVATNDVADHLRIRLRWGSPVELRRLSLLASGYNVWRVPRQAAEQAGFHTTPPTLTQLYSNTNVARANGGPVSATKDFNTGHGPGGADDPADRSTYFFIDDNRRAAYNPPFDDGEEFYYFVTARDVLGRDGLVGPGGLARACRRIPPPAPSDVQVQNAYMTNEQRLVVTWLQDTNITNSVSEYWVYRWPNPAMVFTNDAMPLTNLVGVVTNLPGTNRNAFLDTSPGAPTGAGLSNFWYTVRSVSLAACDPLLSPHSAPAWGVVRERNGPEATTGTLAGSCGTPVVAFQSLNTLTNDPGEGFLRWFYRFTCQRRDPGIVWVQFYITNHISGFPEVESIGPVYFSPEENSAPVDYSLPMSGTNNQVDVTCVVGTLYGVTSAPVSYRSAFAFWDQRQEVVFLAGQLLASGLDSADPLLLALNDGQLSCISAYEAIPDPSGMVRLRFDLLAGEPLLIRANQQGTGWADLGVVAPDSNDVYWVSYPACLVGPMPEFQGCRVRVPTDCLQHVARASDTGPVAPIHVRFRLTQRTREYRVYRQVNGGPLTMFAQGAAVYDPSNPGKLIDRADDAMPVSTADLCYYVQVLDEHGNGSPLTLVGCKRVKPPRLPRPILAEPHSGPNSNVAQVVLNWFCPTAGIHRFQIKIERADKSSPSQTSGISSLRLTPYAFYNAKASYLGLRPSVRSFVARFSEAQLTPPIGTNFGPGPQFTLTADVVPNARYNIAVSAMDDQGNVGDASEVWTFSWRPPVVLPTVPWPVRPLPPVTDFDEGLNPADYEPFYPRVRAVLLTDQHYQMDQRYPVGVAIGYLDNYVNQYTPNGGTTNYASYAVPVLGFIPGSDPHDLVFRRISPNPERNGEMLLPIVVYRQQVTNAAFPKVSGNLTQVTPLIERLPAEGSPCIDCEFLTVTLTDRLLAIIDKFDQLTYRAHTMLCVRDLQPVIRGATYQYFVARMNEKREVSEIISAGQVTIPDSP